MKPAELTSTKQTPTGTTHYTYDALNRLIAIQTPTQSHRYSYGPFNRRLTANSDYFIYDNRSEIGKISSNKITERRILGNTPANEIGATILYEQNNHLQVPLHSIDGNTITLLDPNGIPTHNFTYSAFGETAPTNLPWIYQSKRQDPTGLIYFGSRYYDRDLGRFLTPDPAGFTDSYNFYSYLLNRPFVNADPNGEFIFLLIPIFGGAALGEAIVAGTALALITWGAYQTEKSVNRYLDSMPRSMSWAPSFSRNTELLCNGLIQVKVPQITYPKHMSVGEYKLAKKGSIDDSLPTDPLNDPRYEDVSHPEARAKGHHKLKDKKTGETIEYDKGKPDWPGHKKYDHYHRPNPRATGKGDEYLDGNGKPVPDKSDPSHLYPKEWKWWK